MQYISNTRVTTLKAWLVENVSRYTYHDIFILKFFKFNWLCLLSTRHKFLNNKREIGL
jgi:hypothetical protein